LLLPMTLEQFIGHSLVDQSSRFLAGHRRHTAWHGIQKNAYEPAPISRPQ
jgi:hypothetical protein